MKRFFVILAVLSLAGAAFAQDFGEYPNEIGIFNTATPTGADSEIYIDAPTGAGGYNMFLVISNATDEGASTALETIGGFELSVVRPAGWNMIVTLPAGVLDLDGAAEHFYCSGAIPVTGDFTVLCDIQFGSFGGAESGWIFLTPYSNGEQSIPGHMAITDAENNFVLSRAFPISGSYEDPVAGINMQATPTEDVSWGSVKSLFQ